jgi:hypothetical protein
MAVFYIWNGAVLAEVARPPAVEATKGGVLIEDPSARLVAHGTLQVIIPCLTPDQTHKLAPVWLLQAGNQTVRLNFVNDELTKKGYELSGRPVLVKGYFKNGELVVESLAEDKREKPEPSLQASLLGKLLQTEAGWRMEIDGQTYEVDLGTKAEVQERAKKLIGKTVTITGALETHHLTDGSGQILRVRAETLHDGQFIMK